MKSTKSKLNVTLLRRIQKHILEEPRRFFMGWYVATGRPGSHKFNAPFRAKDLPTTVPPCGTAACIAGWANLLSGSSVESANNFCLAVERLGIDDSVNLFNASEWPAPFSARYTLATAPEDRARIASARINHLIKTGE